MKEKPTKIFFVEDDLNFGSVLKSYLEIQNFKVQWIDDGKKAIELFVASKFDIAILDVMLPHVDGLKIAETIKKADASLPILFLTAKGQKEDILDGYKSGADDYLVKPFDSDILIYKIKALLRRNESGHDVNKNEYSIGKYEFNYATRELMLEDSINRISPKEAELLHLLYRYKNTVMPRSEALVKIWGTNDYFTTRSMDVVITKLRKYLKEDTDIVIENIHTKGYRLKLPS